MTSYAHQQFAGAAHQEFHVDLGAASTTFTLTDLHVYPPQSVDGIVFEPFTLTFRSASQLVLPQRIYRMHNAIAGTADIFIVPVGCDAGGVTYQATFN